MRSHAERQPGRNSWTRLLCSWMIIRCRGHLRWSTCWRAITGTPSRVAFHAKCQKASADRRAGPVGRSGPHTHIGRNAHGHTHSRTHHARTSTLHLARRHTWRLRRYKLNSFSQAACKPTNSFGLILFCFKIVFKIIKNIFKYFYLFIYYFLKIQKWILYFENRESTSDFQKPKMLIKPMLF